MLRSQNITSGEVTNGLAGKFSGDPETTYVGPAPNYLRYRYAAPFLRLESMDYTPAQVAAYNLGNILGADGGVRALSELWPTPVSLNYSASSQQSSAIPCEYGGFMVRSVTGTVNIYACDALTATVGATIHTQIAVAVGPYPWLGAGTGARRQNATALSFIMTGGGTVTIDPLKA